jgi:hypothetical protein
LKEEKKKKRDSSRTLSVSLKRIFSAEERERGMKEDDKEEEIFLSSV